MADHTGEKTGFEAEVIVLYCQHCVSNDNNIEQEQQQLSGLSIRQLMMPCSSKIEPHNIFKILEEGVDATEVVTCPEDKCQLLVGSMKAKKRVEYARHLLDEIGMGADRLGLTQRSKLSAKDLMDLAKTRADKVRPLGPNPMKKGNNQ